MNEKPRLNNKNPNDKKDMKKLESRPLKSFGKEDIIHCADLPPIDKKPCNELLYKPEMKIMVSPSGDSVALTIGGVTTVYHKHIPELGQQKECPKCKSSNTVLFSGDLDICNRCGNQFNFLDKKSYGNSRS